MGGDNGLADRGAPPHPAPESMAGDEPHGVVAYLALQCEQFDPRVQNARAILDDLGEAAIFGVAHGHLPHVIQRRRETGTFALPRQLSLVP